MAKKAKTKTVNWLTIRDEFASSFERCGKLAYALYAMDHDEKTGELRRTPLSPKEQNKYDEIEWRFNAWIEALRELERDETYPFKTGFE